MNNTLRKTVLIVLVFAFFLTDLAHAGSSASIPVSCSIPRVPGLNAPLNEEEGSLKTAVTVENNASYTGEETTTAEEDDAEGEIILTDGNAVRTLYSR